jgi:hypothetical protein
MIQSDGGGQQLETTVADWVASARAARAEGYEDASAKRVVFPSSIRAHERVSQNAVSVCTP